MELFQEFPLKWMYESGPSNIADPLSRLPDEVVIPPQETLLFNCFVFKIETEFKKSNPDFTKFIGQDRMQSGHIGQKHGLSIPAPICQKHTYWLNMPLLKGAFTTKK
jgi:hypothetical protein